MRAGWLCLPANWRLGVVCRRACTKSGVGAALCEWL